MKHNWPHMFESRFPRELSKLPSSIKLASLVIFIYYISWGIANPFVNIFLKDLTGSYSSVGILNAIIYILPVLWIIPFGQIIDKLRKKSIIKLFLLAYLPMGFWLYSLKTFQGAVIWRVYHAVIASFLWFAFVDYIRTKSPKKKTSESFGLFDTAYNLSASIASIGSGFLFVIFGYKIFIIMTIFFALAFLSAGMLPEEKEHVSMKTIRKSLRTPFRGVGTFFSNKKVVFYTMIGLFVKLVYVTLSVLLALYLKVLNASNIMIGVVYGLFLLPSVSESFFSIIADKHKRKWMIRIGLLSGMVLLFMMFLAKSVAIIALLTFLLACSFSMIVPATEGKITSATERKNIGVITAASSSLKDIGGGVGPIVAGFIADSYGLHYIFLLGALVFLGLFIYFTIMVKKLHNGNGQAH